ncbi:unnamed protein product [Owenia fusiformis]|uniref:Uncharacterized protein n=1 Tax=Owenia fusiformis TaxID=6347 RepID=A0A8J1U4W7_OWEFU|nr:unnamed protein product [Owenia fusiformis]
MASSRANASCIIILLSFLFALGAVITAGWIFKADIEYVTNEGSPMDGGQVGATPETTSEPTSEPSQEPTTEPEPATTEAMNTTADITTAGNTTTMENTTTAVPDTTTTVAPVTTKNTTMNGTMAPMTTVAMVTVCHNYTNENNETMENCTEIPVTTPVPEPTSEPAGKTDGQQGNVTTPVAKAVVRWYGLWYHCVYPKCEPYQMDPKPTYFEAVQAMTLVNASLLLIGLLLMMSYLCCDACMERRWAIMFIICICFLATVFAIVSVALFGSFYKSTDMFGGHDGELSYAFGFEVVSGFLSLIGSFLMIGESINIGRADWKV